MTRTLEQRNRDDFEFLVTAHLVGDPAFYALFRDRELDADNAKARLTDAERMALPNEIDTATKD